MLFTTTPLKIKAFWGFKSKFFYIEVINLILVLFKHFDRTICQRMWSTSQCSYTVIQSPFIIKTNNKKKEISNPKSCPRSILIRSLGQNFELSLNCKNFELIVSDLQWSFCILDTNYYFHLWRSWTHHWICRRKRSLTKILHVPNFLRELTLHGSCSFHSPCYSVAVI